MTFVRLCCCEHLANQPRDRARHIDFAGKLHVARVTKLNQLTAGRAAGEHVAEFLTHVLERGDSGHGLG